MKTRFIEACNIVGGKPGNWGKFAVARFEPEEWERPAAAPSVPYWSLLNGTGWDGERGNCALYTPERLC